MSIETTLNMRVEVLEKITAAAETLETSRTRIIIMLLNFVMNDKCIKAKVGSTVLYQEPDPDPNNWHRFHISFREDEIDYYSDLRNIYSQSLSYLVAWAVEEYLDCILGIKPVDPARTDTYRFRNYIISHSEVHGVISWQIFWGLPDKLEELLEKRLI